MTDRPLRPMQDAVYGILAASPCPLTCQQIAAQIGRTGPYEVTNVNRCLRQLESRGLVRYAGLETRLMHPHHIWEARA